MTNKLVNSEVIVTLNSKYLWISDPHLNFLTQSQITKFFLTIQTNNYRGVFLTGDISTGTLVTQHLCWAAEIISAPIYFVLGNHDFYRSTFETVDRSMIELTSKHSNLHYLSACDPVELSPETCVIGHNGWYDARWRDPFTSLVFAWDYFFIKDFRSLASNQQRLNLARQKSDEATWCLEQRLKSVLKTYQTIYLLTHFPPWPERNSSWGRLYEKFWMPYNSAKGTADMLEVLMKDYPDRNLVVLSGHTHHRRTEQVLHNLQLKVGGCIFNATQADTICI